MGIKDLINEEIEKRGELDLSKIPVNVLKKVNERFDSDEEVERVLRIYRKPQDDKLCRCTSEEFICHDGISSDCWLCGGYTY